MRPRVREPAVSQWKQAVATLLVAVSRQSECEIDAQIGKKDNDASYGLPRTSPLRGSFHTSHIHFLLFRNAKRGTVPGVREVLRRALAAPTSVPLDSLIYAALQSVKTVQNSAEIEAFSKNIVDALAATQPKDRRAAWRQQLVLKLALVWRHIDAIDMNSASCSSNNFETKTEKAHCRPDAPESCHNEKKR